MASASSTDMPSDAFETRTETHRERLLVVAAVAASFFVSAAIRAPVPGPNEPHYLGKAKHYWNPAWCRGDFFLESADTHRVFYAVVGPLTLLLPLPVVAVLGRLLAHGLLAIGWTALVRRVAPGHWTPLWAAWLFLVLAAIGRISVTIVSNYFSFIVRFGDLSGEWIVGGVEAKVVGYGFAFLAIAWAIDRRWIAASIGIGLATAWHPLIGLWTVVAAALVPVGWLVGRGTKENDTVPRWPTWRETIIGSILAAVCAAPGLLPAFELFGAEDTREMGTPWTEPVEDIGFAADYIQTQYRLAHHLDPTTFPATVWVAYAAMLVGWFALRRRLPASRGEREFAWFVGGTLVIAVGGLVVAAITHPITNPVAERSVLGMKLLKFYWFRLPDVVVPMAFAITTAGLLSSRSAGDRRPIVALGLAFAVTLCFPGADGAVSALSASDRRAWYEVCDWIREHTPEDARFRTPDSAIAFKWYAHRAEFLSRKDCPQDAPGIVEWNERMQYVADWATRRYDDERYTEAEIRELSRTLDVDYFVAWHLGPIEMEPVFERGPFRVYDVRE